MIDYLAIRDALTIALTPQLGVYTFGNGASVPAVQIDDGSDPLPEQPRASGLELIIEPSIRVPIAYAFGSFRQTFSGKVTVRQWDITKTTLDAMPVILDTLLQEFPGLSVSGSERLIRLQKLDNVETLTVQISQEFLMD